ncbi:MAG: hypothetical protein D6753_00015 [Planctomycetota bacterium]|nr:MAG: hypothetical protein D6753_00015 [Planctomycetota bacterium]
MRSRSRPPSHRSSCTADQKSTMKTLPNLDSNQRPAWIVAWVAAVALLTPSGRGLSQDSTLGGTSGYYASRPFRVPVPQHPALDYVADGLYRQPTAVAVVDPNSAVIATKESGELYLLDLADNSVRSIFGPSDAQFGTIERLDDGAFAVADGFHDTIWIFTQQAEQWAPLVQLSTPGLPKRLLWDGEHNRLWVSAQWARRLHCLVPHPTAGWAQARSAGILDLDFCPGHLLWLSSFGVLIVADAFGRNYAAVDASAWRVVQRGQFYGHNLAGLAATEDQEMIYFPHQLLNEFARAAQTDITWGGMISNNLRWLRTERVLHRTGEDVFRQGKFFPLGTPGNGAADPSSMAIAPDGKLAITLGGTNRVALQRDNEFHFDQIPVGMHPVDCVFTPPGQDLLVVNQFSDSVSRIALSDRTATHIALGPVRQPTEQECGEQLFYDARLAHDGWMSCHSCHSEGHTSGGLNDNFSDHSFSTPKRILSLLGQRETAPYAWDGSMPSLEAQIHQSVTSTMAGSAPPTEEQTRALAAFLRSLPPPPSVTWARNGLPPNRAAGHLTTRIAFTTKTAPRGARLFDELGCVDCHAPPAFTSHQRFDVGLVDENGLAEFNPPSLIGVSQRQDALFHDASAGSIRAVLQSGHQLDRSLPPEDRQALVEFLQAL